MARKNFQSNVATGRWTLPVVIMASALFWGTTAIIFPTPTPDTTGSYPLWLTTNLSLVLPKWAGQIITFLLYALIGNLLIELNNKFAIIRTRATVQTSFFYLLIAVCPFVHQIYTGSLAALGMFLALFFIFRSYQSPSGNSDFFNSFCFIGGTSLFFPQILYLAPFWLLSAAKFQPLSLRNLCSAIIGLIFPYWFLFGYAFFWGDITLFYQPFIDLTTFTPSFQLSQCSWNEIVVYAYMLLLYLAAIVHRVLNGHRNNIRTSAFLDFLITVSFFIFALGLIQPELSISLLPVLTLFISILIGQVFSTTNTKASNIFFIASLAMLLFLFAFNLWMPF